MSKKNKSVDKLPVLDPTQYTFSIPICDRPSNYPKALTNGQLHYTDAQQKVLDKAQNKLFLDRRKLMGNGVHPKDMLQIHFDGILEIAEKYRIKSETLVHWLLWQITYTADGMVILMDLDTGNVEDKLNQEEMKLCCDLGDPGEVDRALLRQIETTLAFNDDWQL